ncbi:diguanylate cyclase domain-containing protein [Dactylosporangium sp. NPDC000521]|uniref:diguanylate cyclase domain-containing protein n=1 Tax=Dactylosporangium sp. NPDC000521 TaxID=3363975 RepID=UPI0036843946
MAQRSPLGELLRDPVLLGLGGLALVVPVWFLAGPGGGAVSWGIQAALDVSIVVFARRLRAQGGTERYQRRFWRAMAVGGLLCAVGDGTQTALTVADPGAPVNIVQSLCVVCAMTVMAVVMLRHPLGDAGRQRMRLWLDAGAVLIGVAVFLWYFSIGAELDSPRLGDRLAAAAGAVVMLVIVLGVLKLILSGTAPFTRQAGIAGCVGVGGTAVGTSVAAILTGVTDPRIEAVASLLPCILTVASLRVQEVQQRRPAEHVKAQQRHFSVMPYVAVVATELLGIVALHIAGADAPTWGVMVGIVLITAVVLTRQLIAFHDNDRLLTDLDRSMLELQRLHGALRHQATHDALTGLANRALLTERLAAIDTAAQLSVLVIDLDGFKQVNDAHGHHAGDALLVQVARRLDTAAGPDALVARLGGDEFALLLPGADADVAHQHAATVSAVLTRPYHLPGTVAHVGASVGVATGTPADAEALLRRADAEMYRCKRRVRLDRQATEAIRT